MPTIKYAVFVRSKLVIILRFVEASQINTLVCLINIVPNKSIYRVANRTNLIIV